MLSHALHSAGTAPFHKTKEMLDDIKGTKDVKKTMKAPLKTFEEPVEAPKRLMQQPMKREMPFERKVEQGVRRPNKKPMKKRAMKKTMTMKFEDDNLGINPAPRGNKNDMPRLNMRNTRQY